VQKPERKPLFKIIWCNILMHSQPGSGYIVALKKNIKCNLNCVLNVIWFWTGGCGYLMCNLVSGIFVLHLDWG
jgi:hypothetical protein